MQISSVPVSDLICEFTFLNHHLISRTKHANPQHFHQAQFFVTNCINDIQQLRMEIMKMAN